MIFYQIACWSQIDLFISNGYYTNKQKLNFKLFIIAWLKILKTHEWACKKNKK